jgi:uncharacterized membrane protein
MIVVALLGGVIGGVLFGDLSGFVFGLIVGALAGWISDLSVRLRQLERRLDARRTVEAREAFAAQSPPQRTRESESAAEAPPVTGTAAAPREPIPSVPPPAPEPVPAAREPAPEPVHATGEPARIPRLLSAAAAGAADRARAMRAAALSNLEPTAIEALFKKVLTWFTTGNVPVKVGVVLSLFGVGFLVKEGIDRQWIVLPIEYRLVLVALFGIGLLALGWWLRARNRIYALSVQGGGIGVLYLTIFAAFSLALMPAAVAFPLLVVVTAAAGALAVLQNAQVLAVLGIVGGFLAPVLVSTGSGNHVTLFSYYALLDLAILGIAWFKAWRVLNLLGFLFTFGIGTLWGIDGYEPEKFATTEPFLVLFTLMYLVIPVLFATRVEPKLRGFVDGPLTFGTPIVAFGLQSQLVADTKYGLAISAVVLALTYAGMATYLFRSQRESLRVLMETHFALGIAFVTVAVPLALDARWTSAAWALQGAALVWLAFRQSRPLALLAGLALQALSGYAYIEQPFVAAEWPILNGYFLGALVLAFAGFFSARLLDTHREQPEDAPVHEGLDELPSIGLFLWAAIWWFFAGVAEIERHVFVNDLAALLGFGVLTAVLALLVAPRVDWPRLDWLGLTLWPIAVFLAGFCFVEVAHPAAEMGWLAWPVAIGSMLWLLRERETRFPRLAGALHVTMYWLAAGLAAWEMHWAVERVADGVWPEAVVLALGAALVIATLRACRAVAWPFAAHARTYAEAGAGAMLAALTLAAVGLNVSSPGDAAPLPYVPLVNPLELASALVLLAVLVWLDAVGRHNDALASAARLRPAVTAVAAWFLVTMTVGRAVHHWANVPYDLESLADSTTFQSALSIVWGLTGIAAMIVGARAARRGVWLAGAALMAVVVAKLFLVDLGNTDTLARVVSFLGVGALLLVVGYFAPVPPRAEAAARAT